MAAARAGGKAGPLKKTPKDPKVPNKQNKTNKGPKSKAKQQPLKPSSKSEDVTRMLISTSRTPGKGP